MSADPTDPRDPMPFKFDDFGWREIPLAEPAPPPGISPGLIYDPGPRSQVSDVPHIVKAPPVPNDGDRSGS
jgi:hypothetical protein